MNRQEFIIAHREARKVLALNLVMRQSGFDGNLSLVSTIPEPVFCAAIAFTSKAYRSGDVLMHRYFRNVSSGKWSRLSLLRHFCRPVLLPGASA